MTKQLAGMDLHRLQQTLKWVVYSFLIINFVYYIYEDTNRALHVLTDASTFADLAEQYAVTLAVLAWLLLIAMFELETYSIDDRNWTRSVERTVHGVRIISYLMIAHTVFAFVDGVMDYTELRPVEAVSGLCDLADREVSFVYNLEYTEVTTTTCATLTSETALYWVGEIKDPIVSTLAGWQLEKELAWSDLIEIVTWLIIIALIELVVRLQGRGITGGRLIDNATRIKLVLYGVLFALSAWWTWLGHWIYAWDTFVWIAGFAAIEMNVSEWREEILGEQAAA
ncbi:MAG: hypothetical protein AAF917_03205 [Pseudomonadota bacterium]